MANNKDTYELTPDLEQALERPLRQRRPLAAPQGDGGGAYGLGRPAHKPDPSAAYGFNPGPARTLPPHPKVEE